MSEYPKAKYHKTKEPILVHTPEQEEALSPEWKDGPNEAAATLDEVKAKPTKQG